MTSLLFSNKLQSENNNEDSQKLKNDFYDFLFNINQDIELFKPKQLKESSKYLFDSFNRGEMKKEEFDGLMKMLVSLYMQSKFDEKISKGNSKFYKLFSNSYNAE
jgi:tRNA C32,U32 (ribose-2'-O)-methylase TrmJ